MKWALIFFYKKKRVLAPTRDWSKLLKNDYRNIQLFVSF